MFCNSREAGLIAIAGILLFSTPARSQLKGSIAAKSTPSHASKRPTITAKCLAPGSSRPVACATSKAGASLELVATGALSDAPPALIFREVGGAGRQSKLQIKWFLDQDMAVKARIPASRQLCPASAKGQQLQFEMQLATSDMNQAQSGSADSVGFFQMRC